MKEGATPLRLAVLNHRGRDSRVDYQNGPGVFQPGIHPPVNFHAFAAASRGAFLDSVDDVLNERDRYDACLVLLRRKMKPCLEAIEQLRKAEVPVLVSWKECGTFQIAHQLTHPGVFSDYRKALTMADALISPASEPPPVPPGVEIPVLTIPTPYPVEFPEWNFSPSVTEVSGILIGTREFQTPARRHLAAVTLALRVAEELMTRVTVINRDGKSGRKLLESLCPSPETLDILEGNRPYDQWLQLVASHRVVFQLDRGSVPGQVAGDALLARTVCLGGNSLVEKMAFPEWPASDDHEAEATLRRLLTDSVYLQHQKDLSQEIAAREIAYGPVATAITSRLREVNVLP